MRRVFKGGAVLALIVIFAAPALYADDPPPLNDPPGVRIAPPTGVTSAEPVPDPPGVRITPPTGVTSAAPAPEPPSVRIAPPGGLMDQDFFELFWVWLQVRIGPPIG
ncbi:MAG: hypothetical protein DMF56_09375 [Acidobacteria bacterium]|nr:MAG: hypothetical protein DMF56_09375 [Acidobacteriota bacterium]